MFIDVGGKLSVARAMRYVRLATLRNTLALLLPAMDTLDPIGIVIEDRVVRNG